MIVITKRKKRKMLTSNIGVDGPRGDAFGQNFTNGGRITGPMTVTSLSVDLLETPAARFGTTISITKSMIFNSAPITSDQNIYLAGVGLGTVSIANAIIDDLSFGGVGGGGAGIVTIPDTFTHLMVRTGTLGSTLFLENSISVTTTNGDLVFSSAGLDLGPYVSVGPVVSRTLNIPLQIQGLSAATTSNRTLTNWRAFTTTPNTNNGKLMAAVIEKAPEVGYTSTSGEVILVSDNSGTPGVTFGGNTGSVSMTGNLLLSTSLLCNTLSVSGGSSLSYNGLVVNTATLNRSVTIDGTIFFDKLAVNLITTQNTQNLIISSNNVINFKSDWKVINYPTPSNSSLLLNQSLTFTGETLTSLGGSVAIDFSLAPAKIGSTISTPNLSLIGVGKFGNLFNLNLQTLGIETWSSAGTMTFATLVGARANVNLLDETTPILAGLVTISGYDSTTFLTSQPTLSFTNLKNLSSTFVNIDCATPTLNYPGNLSVSTTGAFVEFATEVRMRDGCVVDVGQNEATLRFESDAIKVISVTDNTLGPNLDLVFAAKSGDGTGRITATSGTTPQLTSDLSTLVTQTTLSFTTTTFDRVYANDSLNVALMAVSNAITVADMTFTSLGTLSALGVEFSNLMLTGDSPILAASTISSSYSFGTSVTFTNADVRSVTIGGTSIIQNTISNTLNVFDGIVSIGTVTPTTITANTISGSTLHLPITTPQSIIIQKPLIITSASFISLPTIQITGTLLLTSTSNSLINASTITVGGGFDGTIQTTHFGSSVTSSAFTCSLATFTAGSITFSNTISSGSLTFLSAGSTSHYVFAGGANLTLTRNTISVSTNANLCLSTSDTLNTTSISFSSDLLCSTLTSGASTTSFGNLAVTNAVSAQTTIVGSAGSISTITCSTVAGTTLSVSTLSKAPITFFSNTVIGSNLEVTPYGASGSVTIRNTSVVGSSPLLILNNTLSSGATITLSPAGSITSTKDAAFATMSLSANATAFTASGVAGSLTAAGLTLGSVMAIPNLVVSAISVSTNVVQSTGTNQDIIFLGNGTSKFVFQNSAVLTSNGLTVTNNTLNTNAASSNLITLAPASGVVTTSRSVTATAVSASVSCTTLNAATATVGATLTMNASTARTFTATTTTFTSFTQSQTGNLLVISANTIASQVAAANLVVRANNVGVVTFKTGGAATEILTISNNTVSVTSGTLVLSAGTISITTNLSVGTLSITSTGAISATPITCATFAVSGAHTSSGTISSVAPITANTFTSNAGAFTITNNTFSRTTLNQGITLSATLTNPVRFGNTSVATASYLTISNATLSTTGNIVLNPTGTNIVFSASPSFVTFLGTSVSTSGTFITPSLIGSLTLTSPTAIALMGSSFTLSNSSFIVPNNTNIVLSPGAGGTVTVGGQFRALAGALVGSTTFTTNTISSTIASLTFTTNATNIVWNPAAGSVSSTKQLILTSTTLGTPFIGVGTLTTATAATFLVEVTGTSAVMFPRMSSLEKRAINTFAPPTSIDCYDNTNNCKTFFNGTAWVDMTVSGYTLASITTAFTTSVTGTWTDFTGFVDITVATSTFGSRVEVQFSSGVSFAANQTNTYLRLQRKKGSGGTYVDIAFGDVRGSTLQCWIDCAYATRNAGTPTLDSFHRTCKSVNGIHTDAPNYQGTVYYKLQYYTDNTAVFGGTSTTTVTAGTYGAASTPSTFVLREILTASTAYPTLEYIGGQFATTATAGGTTTFTNASLHTQEFTGTLVQSLLLPVTTTLQSGTFNLNLLNNCSTITATALLKIPGPTFLMTIPPQVKMVAFYNSGGWILGSIKTSSAGFIQRVASASTQPFTSAVNAKVVFDSASASNTFDADKITVTTNSKFTNSAGRGMFLVISATVRTIAAYSNSASLWISINGASLKYGQNQYYQTTSAVISLHTSATIYLANGDYFEVWGNFAHASGATTGNTSPPDASTITIKEI